MKRKKYVEDYFYLEKNNDIRRYKKNNTKNKKMGKIIFFDRVTKKGLIYISCVLFIALVFVANIVGSKIKYVNNNYDAYNSVNYKDNRSYINSLVDTYNNADIVGALSIKNKKGDSYLTTPFAKTYNNEFYKDHDLYKKSNLLGGSFLDCSINLNNGIIPKNIVIYGCDLYKKSPFNKIRSFEDKEIFENNNIIELKFKNMTLYYEIFAFSEQEKFIEDKIEFKSNMEFLEYINDIEESAKYFTDISEENEILTLSTSFNKLNNNVYKLHAKKINY